MVEEIRKTLERREEKMWGEGGNMWREGGERDLGGGKKRDLEKREKREKTKK